MPWAARRLLYNSINFTPLPAQERALADTDVPFLAFAGGVGAGKSYTAAKYLLPEVLPNYMRAALLNAAGIECNYRGKQDETRRYFWLAGPDYTLCRREFDLLVQDLHALGVELDGPNMPQEGPWWLKIKDSKTEVETKSASQPDSFHSKPVQGILACEAALISPYVRTERLIPRVTRGVSDGWMFCSGTFEGVENWMVNAYEEGQEEGGSWHSYSMASWDNTVDHPNLTPEMREWLNWYVKTMPTAKVMGDQENREALSQLKQQAQDIYHALANMPVDSFAQRFGAIPQKPTGLVFPEFDERVHVDHSMVFDNTKPVEVWIDPGVENPYAVLAVQFDGTPGTDGSKVAVIDEAYFRHCTSEEMIQECVGRPWWSNVTSGQIDATQVEQRAVWQRGEIWNKVQRTPPYLRAQKVLIDIGIERTRVFLRDPATQEPRITFSNKCHNTIKEFGQYRWPSFKGGDAVRKTPEDRHNHSLKALAYGLVGAYGIGTHLTPIGTRTMIYKPRFPFR